MGLAERLHMTYGELCRRMDSAELSLWQVKDRIEPPPDPWLQHGMLMALIANALGARRAKPEDFMPGRRAAPARVQSQAEQRARMAAMAEAMARKPGG